MKNILISILTYISFLYNCDFVLSNFIINVCHYLTKIYHVITTIYLEHSKQYSKEYDRYALRAEYTLFVIYIIILYDFVVCVLGLHLQ